MTKKIFLKRFVPFLLALGLGLFVASFFVSIALPNVRVTRKWRSHREYHRTMEFENQRLRHENCRLRREAMRNRVQDRNADFDSSLQELVPPPPPIPVAPRRVK